MKISISSSTHQWVLNYIWFWEGWEEGSIHAHESYEDKTTYTEINEHKKGILLSYILGNIGETNYPFKMTLE